MVGETLRAPHIPLGIEVQQPLTVPYKEFFETNKAEPGTVLVDVKPRDLFTYQGWTDDNKVMNVLNYAEENDPRLYSVTGYVHYHTKFQENVLVIGNGHHRALYALHTGNRVDFTVEDYTPESKENPFRLTNLVRKYGNIFGSL